MMTPNMQELHPALCAHATRATYDAGAAVFRMYSPTHSVFYVESGGVRLLRYGPAGEEVLLHDARAGEFFAEASLDSALYHCDAIASESCELLQVPTAAQRELLDSDSEFARHWMFMLPRQLRAVRTRGQSRRTKWPRPAPRRASAHDSSTLRPIRCLLLIDSQADKVTTHLALSARRRSTEHAYTPRRD